MTVDKVIAKIIWLIFFGPPCYFKVNVKQFWPCVYRVGQNCL